MKGSKIVYIEDQPDMIELVDLILGSKGYTVIGAEHGPEGMDIIERERPQLILLDVMMPDMDGWQLYDKLRSDDALKSIPVIIFTAKRDKMSELLGLNFAGVDGYVNKADGPKALIDSVESVLARHERI